MKEALKLALEALETERENYQDWDKEDGAPEYIHKAITKCKEALAQPEQEPAAFGMLRADGLILDVICPDEHESFAGEYTIPLYTTPPKRPWGGLTDEFCITNMFDMGHYSLQIVFKSRKNADEFKASLKEKNT